MAALRVQSGKVSNASRTEEACSETSSPQKVVCASKTREGVEEKGNSTLYPLVIALDQSSQAVPQGSAAKEAA